VKIELKNVHSCFPILVLRIVFHFTDDLALTYVFDYFSNIMLH